MDTSTRNVYVASLPEYFRDEDLRQLCEAFGKIESVKVMVDTHTRRCKGSGFVLFSRDEEATAAIQGLFGKAIEGNLIQVKRARRSTRGPQLPVSEQQREQQSLGSSIVSTGTPGTGTSGGSGGGSSFRRESNSSTSSPPNSPPHPIGANGPIPIRAAAFGTPILTSSAVPATLAGPNAMLPPPPYQQATVSYAPITAGYPPGGPTAGHSAMLPAPIVVYPVAPPPQQVLSAPPATVLQGPMLVQPPEGTPPQQPQTIVLPGSPGQSAQQTAGMATQPLLPPPPVLYPRHF